MTSGDPRRHRVQLWLRSERAMGLPWVPRAAIPQFPAAPAPQSKPVQRPVPSSSPPPPLHRPLPVAAQAPAKSAQPTNAPRPSAAAAAPGLSLPVFTGLGPITEPVVTRDEKIRLLDELNKTRVAGCTACGLHETRTRTVFGEGDPDAELCFVGEGPGKDEDASGRPFVGRAGQKLDEMIRAMGLKREQVYICNIVKCRAYLVGPPAKDRPPSEDETAACSPRLVRQLEIIRPKVIVTLGLPATKFILSTKSSMSSMRGQWHSWRGIKVMPTWHPAYILRNYTAATRQQVWDDLKMVMSELGLAIPNKSGKQT